jgi:hypothetical protein
MSKIIVELLADIEAKGFMGAGGGQHLAADPDWIELKAQLVKKPEPVKVAPKVVALPVHKAGKK